MKFVHWLFLLVFSVIAGQVFSQEFHGGVTAGLVGSQVAGDNYSGFKKAGMYAGGYISWDFTKRSGLQLELTYFQKGSRENPTEKNGYINYLFRANYIELPVLYLLKFNKFYLLGGPSLGFNVGYYETDQDGYEISNSDIANKPAPVSLQINLGMRFFITEKFGFDFRTNNSLLNIRTENRGGDVWRLWGYGQFHDALALSLFYQFR